MKLHSPALEGRLRAGVRRTIRSSPALRREAKLQRRSKSRTSGGGLFRLVATGLLLAVMAAGAAYEAGLNYKLAIITLWGVMTVSFQASGLANHLYRDPGIHPLILLPVSDEFIFRWQKRIFLRKNLGVWIDNATAFALLAVLSGIGAGGWIAVPVLATAQWLIILALAAAYVAHPLRGVRIAEMLLPIIAIVFILLVVERKFTGPHLASWLDASAPWLNLLLPTGWAVTIFDRVILKHEWIALLLASPMALVVALGFRSWKRLRQNYSLDVTDTAPAQPESETGEEVPTPPSPPKASPTEVLDGIMAREFLRPASFTGSGPLERFVFSRLSARECLLVETMAAEPIRWTSRWRKAAWFMAGGMLTAWMLQRMGAAWFGWVDGFVLLVAIGMTMSTSLRSSAGLAAALPLNMKEMARLKTKLALVRCTTALPLFAIYGCLFALRLGQSPVIGASLGAKLVAMFLALAPFFVVAQVSSGTSDTKVTRLRSLWSLAVLLGCALLIVGFVVATVVTDVAGGPMWAGWACVPGVAITSWLLLAYYQRQFNRCRFDITDWPASAIGSWNGGEEED